MMLKIYFVVFGLIFVGGILAYGLGSAWSTLSLTMQGIDPGLAANPAGMFLDAVWVWMVLAIIIAAFIYEVVNTQREAQPYA